MALSAARRPHSGASSTDGPTAGTVRRYRTLEGAVTSGAVVGADGTIYVAASGNGSHALDPATSADRWTYTSGGAEAGDLSTSALVLPDGTVLWGDAGKDLVALSPAGAVLRTQPLPGHPTSPVTVDGTRGHGRRGDRARRLPPGAHHQVWSLDLGSSSYGSVVTDGFGRIYTTADTALVALDDNGATATMAWRAHPGDDITEVSTGLAPDGTMLLGKNGTEEWAYPPDWNAPRATPTPHPRSRPKGSPTSRTTPASSTRRD